MHPFEQPAALKRQPGRSGHLVPFALLVCCAALTVVLLPQVPWLGALLLFAVGGCALFLLAQGERRQGAQLKAAEQRLEEFQRTAQVGSWDWDIASDRLTFSAEACRIFGVPLWAAPATYSAFLELLPPEERGPVGAAVSAALAGAGDLQLEHGVRLSDGSRRSVAQSGNLLRDLAGAPLHLNSVVQDVTGRNEAESALFFEKRYRALTENLPQRIFLKDVHSVYLSCNSSFARELGLEPAQVFGRTDFDLFPPQLARKRLEDDARILADGVPEERDEQRERDGVWISKALIPLKDDAGQPYGLLGILTDITSRKQAEEQLKESEERFRNTFEQAAVGICHLTLKGGLIRINRRFCDILGYTQQELLGRGLEEIIHPDDLAPELDNVERLLRREIDNYSMELRHVKKDGSLVWVNFSMSLVRSGAGEPRYFTAVIEDVTAKREAEALRRERDLVQASSRAMSQFLANMSHEIRTPMNAVIGLGHLALKTELTPKQRDYLEKICSSSRNLLEIINDILDFSKIEAGRIELERTEFKLAQVLKTVSDMAAPKAQEKGIGYRVRVAPELPAVLVGDPLRLAQVLNNLIGNAVKFTEKGEVVVDVRPTSREESEVAVRFTVQDTGVGLTSEQMEKIFTPFTQADSSTTRRYGGTGLGLSISSQLVELMGGGLGVQSVPGSGSSFSFTIGFGLPRENEREAPVDCELPNLRVLALESEPLPRERLGQCLAGLPFTVDMTATTASALAALRRAALPGAPPIDLLVLSEATAGSDGLEEICRELDTGNGARPAVLVTVAAERQYELKERAALLGLTCILPVPAKNALLLDAIVRALSREEAESQPNPPRPETLLPADAPDPLQQLPGFDLADALRRLGGNRPLLMKLLLEFRKDFGAAAAAIAGALERGEPEEAKRLSHTLKGVSGNLSATAVQAAALALERGIASGAATGRLLGELTRALAAFLAAIDALPAPAAGEPPAPRGGVEKELLAAEIAELERLLTKNSLNAKRQFAKLRGGLAQGEFEQEMKEMESCMDRLEFKKARALLARLGSRIGEPAAKGRDTQ